MATTDFRIAAAQVASARGDIVGNIAAHTAAIEVAAALGVSVLIFPELSLTGYEPDLATELAQAAGTERCLVVATSDRGEWHGEVLVM